MSPYISIICPCFNGAAFIECAILSVLSQPEDNIELIIIDDGSTDDLSAICDKYVCEKVKYFRTDNLGAGHARNYGLEQSRGVWVMYLDADDLYLPDSISSELIEKLQKYYDEGKDIILTSSIKADMALTKVSKYYSAEKEYRHIPNREFWSWIYRRDYLVDYGISFFEYRAQDIETAFRYRAISQTDRITADESIMFYLQRDNQLSNQNTWNETTLHCVKAQVYKELLDQCTRGEDRQWLYDVVLTEIRLFFQKCMTEKCKSREYIHTMNSLFREMSKGNESIGIPRLGVRTKSRYLTLIIKANIMQTIIEKEHNIVNDPVHSTPISTAVIMQRLTDLGHQVRAN